MALTTKCKLPRSLLVLVTTCCSLLIAGCGSLGSARTGAQPCNEGVCKAEVNVSLCWITVDPDPIHVPKEVNHIEWTFSKSTNGYHFEQDGITIKDPSGSGITPDPGPDPVSGKKGKKFTMKDDHKVHGKIPYTVRVVWDDGPACPPTDPMISND
jgi:hypothetical protein